MTIRPPFLVLTPACIFLGYCTARMTAAEIDPKTVILVLIGGLSAHISVNTLNDYLDFLSGLDFKTLKTPFSGGALLTDPSSSKLVLSVALFALAATVLIVLGMASSLLLR